MKEYNFKNLMYARNKISKIPKEDIINFENEVYSYQGVLCVDCVHVNNDYNQVYIWYIPTTVEIEIEIDDTLVVEQTVGIGLAFVKAVSIPYYKTKEQHEKDIHPYCRVLKNLGNGYL